MSLEQRGLCFFFFQWKEGPEVGRSKPEEKKHKSWGKKNTKYFFQIWNGRVVWEHDEDKTCNAL